MKTNEILSSCRSRALALVMMAGAVGMLQPAEAGYTVEEFFEYFNLDPSNDPSTIRPGVWHLNIMDCKTYAEEHDMPLFVVYSQCSCLNCDGFDRVLVSEPIRKFLAESVYGKVVLCYATDEYEAAVKSSPGVYWASANWTKRKLPLSVFYWKSKGVDAHFESFGSIDNWDPYSSFAANALIKKFETYFAGWTGPKEESSELGCGTSFIVGTNRFDRLEAEVGLTTSVTVPMSSTNVLKVAFTNSLVSVRNDGAVIGECAVVWLPGVTATNAVVKMPEGFKAGDEIRLSILNGRREVVDESRIFCVAGQKATSGNPHWGNEAFGFGEWTMNFAAATNLAGTATGDAYTLLFFTGSLWCQYCKGLEQKVVSTERFTDYCRTKQIALVLLDQPHFGSATDFTTGAPPTLLRYARGVANRANPDLGTSERYGSGASYMSRHMVSEKDAEAALRRNSDFAYGIYGNPNQAYDVPYMVLLRKDGTSAGRVALDAVKDYSEPGGIPSYQARKYKDANGDNAVEYDLDATMLRLGELVAQATSASERMLESANDKPSTASAFVVGGAPCTDWLSANDPIDFWEVTGSAGKTVEIIVSGEGTGRVGLSFRDAAGVPVGTSATGGLREGVHVCATGEGGRLFLRVAADTVDMSKGWEKEDSAFYARSLESTRRCYSITSRQLLNPGTGEGQTISQLIDSIRAEIALFVEEGMFYQISCPKREVEVPASLQPVEDLGAEGLYRAIATGAADVTVIGATDEPTTFVCTLVAMDEIGFVSPAPANTNDFRESAIGGEGPFRVKFQVDLARQEGHANAVSAHVRLVEATTLPEAKKCPYELGEGWRKEGDAYIYDITWSASEKGPKEVGFDVKQDLTPFGDTVLKFALEVGAGSLAQLRPGATEFVARIIDDDEPNVGRLRIARTTPACARPMSVVAVGGSTLKVGVMREVGVTGAVSAELKLVVDGVVRETKRLSWADQDDDGLLQECAFTLPAYGEAKCVTVELSSPDGVPVVSEESVITVTLSSGEVPRSETGDWVASVAPHTPVSHVFTLVNIPEGAECVVEKISGNLPSGLTGSCSGTSFTVSGTPEREGTSGRAVYQVLAVGDGRVMRGETFSVELKVLTAADVAKETGGDFPMLTKAVTYSNVPCTLAIPQGDEAPAGATNYVAMLLTLTLPPNGRASAKVTYEAGEGYGADTLSFSSEGWTSITPMVLLTTLRPRDSAVYSELAIRVEAGGKVTATLAKTGELGVWTIDLVAPDWGEDGAAAWAASDGGCGTYTVQMPQCLGVRKIPASGDASMVLKTAPNGQFIYAGTLADGRSVSGSGILLRKGGEEAVAPFFSYSHGLSAYEFSGVLAVAGGAEAARKESVRRDVRADGDGFPRWVRTDTVERTTYMDAYGAWFVGGEITSCCLDTLESLGGIGMFLDSENYWDAFAFGKTGPTQLAGLAVSLADNRVAFSDEVAAKRYSAQLAYDPINGIVSGSLRLQFAGRNPVKASYRGVLLPGWPSPNFDCGCVLSDIPQRSLMTGACWFEDTDGTNVFKNGCGILIDKLVTEE